MKIQKINCASCSAPINIPSDTDSIKCGFCGTSLLVTRGEGGALQIAENVRRTIQEVGEQTTSSIREISEATQLELKRMQLQQELSSLQLQISNVQSEIRNIELGRKNHQSKKLLKELYEQKNRLVVRTQLIQESLNSQDYTNTTSVVSTSTRKKESRTKTGCLVGFLVFMVVGVGLSMIAEPLDNALINMNLIDPGAETAGPFMTFATYIGLLAGVVAFLFYLNPDSKLWKSIKNKFSRNDTTD